MRKTTFFPLMAIAVTLSFTSCKNSSEDNTNTSKTDSTKVTTAAPELTDAVIVRHKVVNFAKWQAAYEKDDSMRMTAGIHNFVVARGVEDSSVVMVSMKIEDTARAKHFMANPMLKKVMQDAGVIGEPKSYMVHRVFIDSSTDNILLRQMVAFKVKDYDTWKKAFDSDKQARADNGIKDRIICQSVDDKNMVVLFVAITDAAKAKAFMTSPALKAKMKEGGVEGAPEMFMYQVVKKY
jgi:hypothetical protein